jgi:lysophospholipase L1-like esterase
LTPCRRLAAALLLLGLLPSPAAAQTAPKKFLAFGDSITEGVGDDPARAQKGYPPRLETRLQTAGVAATLVNAGKGGEKTPEGLTRIDGVLAQGAPGDVLILMEGTNDVTQRDDIPLETTVFNLDRMAERAETLGLTVIHATVIPRPPNAKIDADNVLTDQLNGRIRHIAGVRQRRLADPNEVFRGTAGLFGTYYSTDPEDRVGHPNAAGYDLLTGVFFNLIQGVDLVPPVPGITNPMTGARNVQPGASFSVDVWDFGEGADLANTFLLVNGQTVTATPTGNPNRANLTYQPLTPLAGTVRIGLRSRDLAVPPNTIDREVASFQMQGAASLQGDMNADNRVDGMDLILFGRRFGSQIGDANWEENADFNADGRVDGSDLAVLASNFGRTASGS